jgi:hypothetical protein
VKVINIKLYAGRVAQSEEIWTPSFMFKKDFSSGIGSFLVSLAGFRSFGEYRLLG